MVFKQIRNIIALRLEIDPEDIQLDSSFEDMDIDSLYLVEIIMAVEDELGISFEEVDDLITVADLVEHAESLLKEF